MGTTYTYLIADLREGTILDELPLSGVSFDKKLNDSGTLRGQVRVDDPELRVREPRSLTEPGRTAIYVDRDGDLLWGGIIWTSRYSAAKGTLELGASDFLSYFDHRLVLDPADLTRTVPFTGDQIAVAQGAVRLAQSHVDGDLGVTFLGATASGVARTVSYTPAEAKAVAEVLRDLAGADDGFDFAFDVRYDGSGAIERFLRFGYPRLGQPGGPHVWEYGANLIDFGWPSDAASMATRMLGTSSGGTGAPVIRADPSAHGAGWPLLEAAAPQLDTADANLLAAHVAGELAVRRRPVVLPELTVRADLDPVVGSYSVGDDARMLIDDPFFAGDLLDVTVRILGFSVTPGDDAGQEEVVLTVAPILGTG
ncbi:hypothetical protein DMH01_02960 [Amycolatopsis sp. WAC 04182]|uniref:hypothetical protein n=1 Tax=Amycolatopsis sp. WAC 04182 TaxID=2203198 RepID=UPI000F76B549|nr:hypothetical protein [Amycolatopsis sp. WAC 04182]RSN65357.1 hypothetical protein DMH01_02960 [Amycolatopsis sp. WAC 04182]